MPTNILTPQTDDHAFGMCILHTDYHEMTGDCWQACAEWNSKHFNMDFGGREAYQARVEMAMLINMCKDGDGLSLIEDLVA